jgi:histidinol-phosphate aminotransferase
LFCLVEKNDEVVFSAPCPAEYRNIVRVLGGKDITVPNGSDLTPIPDLISSACNSKTKAIYLKNPLYFCGLPVRHRDMVELLSLIEKNRILLIIDECEDVPTVSSNVLIGTLLFKDFRNVVPIRSFYDYFNIGCGDLAYAVMPADLAKEYQKVSRTSFVPPILIRQATTILKRSDRIDDLKKKIRIEKEKVNHRLATMELHPLRNCTSGICIPIRNCDRVWERLFNDRIILTNGNSIGIQDHLILSLGLPEENERFVSGLGKVMRTIGK